MLPQTSLVLSTPHQCYTCHLVPPHWKYNSMCQRHHDVTLPLSQSDWLFELLLGSTINTITFRLVVHKMQYWNNYSYKLTNCIWQTRHFCLTSCDWSIWNLMLHFWTTNLKFLVIRHFLSYFLARDGKDCKHRSWVNNSVSFAAQSNVHRYCRPQNSHIWHRSWWKLSVFPHPFRNCMSTYSILNIQLI